MSGITDELMPHPLWEVERANRAEIIQDQFRPFIEDTFDDFHFSLYRFSSVRPLLYVDHETIDNALDHLKSNIAHTLAALHKLRPQLSHAIFSLIRKSPSWHLEDSLSLQDPQDFAQFDSIWHPEYQRYSEHIFNHLIQIPLYILGKQKGKNYTSQALSNRAMLLRNSGFGHFAKGFDSVVRNAIAHGTISYEVAGVDYIDRRDTRSISHFEFAELFDDLVTTCNSLVCALLLFLVACKNHSEGLDLSRLPLGLRFLLVDGLVSHEGFRPILMIESQIQQDRDQLNAICEIDSTSRSIQMMEALSLCMYCLSLGGDSYNRYFVSMQSGYAVPSSLVIDGDRLDEAIQANVPVDEIDPDLFEASLLWYDSTRLMSKVYLWRNLLKAKWKEAKSVFKQQMEDSGFGLISNKYEIRHIENKSSDRHPRVAAHAILKVHGEITDEELLKISRHAARRLRRKWFRKLTHLGEKGLPRRPKYIWIRFYSADNRLRRLKSYSWANPELIAGAEWISSQKVMDYFYTRNPDLTSGKLRLKFNPQLVKAN